MCFCSPKDTHQAQRIMLFTKRLITCKANVVFITFTKGISIVPTTLTPIIIQTTSTFTSTTSTAKTNITIDCFEAVQTEHVQNTAPPMYDSLVRRFCADLGSNPLQ